MGKGQHSRLYIHIYTFFHPPHQPPFLPHVYTYQGRHALHPEPAEVAGGEVEAGRLGEGGATVGVELHLLKRGERRGGYG